MRILIADDEYAALRGMTAIVQELEPAAEIAAFRKASEVFKYIKEKDIDIAFLDIQMAGTSGLEIAAALKKKNERVNIIFVTGYDEFMPNAFELHVSGYVLKPVDRAEVEKQLNNLLYPVERVKKNRLYCQCFGSFEVYLNGKPMRFKHGKTKELFAYLYDRRGAFANNAEIIAALWDDDEHSDYLRQIRKDLVDSLEEKYLSDVLVRRRGEMALDMNLIDSDFKNWLEHPEKVRYLGEYMTQYSWSEVTNAAIYRRVNRL